MIEGTPAHSSMDVSIILVSYNTVDLLAECLRCIHRSAPELRREIIVVDNASRDGSAEFIKTHHPECRLISNAENVGFGRAANQALQWAGGRYVLLVNTDAFVETDTIAKTIAYMDAHPNCGILGVKLIARDGEVQPSARYFPTPWNMFVHRAGLLRFFKGVRMVDDMSWDHASVRHCDWVPGCYYLVRKAVIDQVGLFDPRYFLYHEEVDHCFAARKAGWGVVYFPESSVIHLGGQSAKSEGVGLTASINPQLEAHVIESELLYFRKNHGIADAWLGALLMTLGDAIIVLKRLAKWRLPIDIRAHARHATLVWSIFRRTSWGTRPTR